MSWRAEQGDAMRVGELLEPQSVDAIVTDPPYGIGFMAQKWDTFSPANVEKINARKRGFSREERNPNLRGRQRWWAGAQVEYAKGLEASRQYQEWISRWAESMLPALKPAANVLVCASPRMLHRTTCGLEDAGFEIRDLLLWIHGSGFPKSTRLAPRVGTALKPAYEPIVIARAPFEGPIWQVYAENGTGGLSVLDCLIEGLIGDGHWSGDDGSDATSRPGYDGGFTQGGKRRFSRARDEARKFAKMRTLDDIERDGHVENVAGRWPANLTLDPEAAVMLDAMSGDLRSGGAPSRRFASLFSDRVYSGKFEGQKGVQLPPGMPANTGGASRFFYCAKASQRERDLGCEAVQVRRAAERVHRTPGSKGMNSPRAGAGRTSDSPNHHPTVKPLDLMRWLVRLCTRPNAMVVDPFMGSGTTGMACVLEGRRFAGFDKEAEYVEIAKARIRARDGGPLFSEGT